MVQAGRVRKERVIGRVGRKEEGRKKGNRKGSAGREGKKGKSNWEDGKEGGREEERE